MTSIGNSVRVRGRFGVRSRANAATASEGRVK
jgi:hypothetical protein